MKIHYGSFRLAINSSYIKIIDVLKKFFPEIIFSSDSLKQLKLNNYFIGINENEDYNLLMISKDNEDSFLYYENNVDFYIIDENQTTLENEIYFVKFLKRKFLEEGINEIEIISEFEHLL